MKTLEEKKLLVKMARAFNQPVDQELLDSIEKEERLNEAFFGIKRVEQPKIPILKEEIPPPQPEKSFEPIIAANTVQQTMEVLNTVTPKIVQTMDNTEIVNIKKTISGLMQKINTLSWGGGGTGVVNFKDLDDHRYPKDIDYLGFNETQTDLSIGQYALPGMLWWNTEEDCLNIKQTDNTTLQVGLEHYIRVRNYSGNTMNSGTLVQFAGVNGSYDPIAAPLLANSTFNPIYTIGVVTEPIANGEVGRATVFGKVRDINTTGSLSGETWNLGDLLWASPSQPGLLTKVKPTAPNVAISIAAVTRVDATQGEILVRPTIEPRKYYGSFADKTTQTCAASNTATAMRYNTTEFSSGHVITNYQTGTNNAIRALNAGLYNYQFSSQFTSSSSSRTRIWIWIRKNGVDVPDSATVVAIESNGGVTAPSWNFVVSMNANDVFQLMWATEDHTRISMINAPATAFCPAIPSVLLSVTQVAE